MSKTERDDVDWATAAEQSSEVEEAQEGDTAEHDEESVEAAADPAARRTDSRDPCDAPASGSALA